ncbi:MAG: hypothetical protein R3F56_14450 [Planctomycetota bacterium]
MAWLQACRDADAQTEGPATQAGGAGAHHDDKLLAAAGESHGNAHGAHEVGRRSPPRPAGAGRWVVAVVVDAEADVEPHEVLGLERQDVLVLASPGPCLRPEELALLEHAVRAEHLALCVLMVRAGGTTVSAEAESPAARALRRRLPGPPAGARASADTAAERHAEMQSVLALTASDELQQAAKHGLFRTAVAVLPPRGTQVRFVAPWFERPLADELVAEQAARLDAQASSAPDRTPARPENVTPPADHRKRH